MDTLFDQVFNFEVTTTLALSTIIALVCFLGAWATKKGSWGDDVYAPDMLSDDDSISDNEFPGGELKIFFGTQTGFAETFANQIGREGADFGFKCTVVNLEECESTDFREVCLTDDLDGCKAVFLVSTYGEGEPPDAAKAFHDQIRSRADDSGEKDASYLDGLDFAVFALGSTQYEHFCGFGKWVDQYLPMVGAKRIADVCLGDDDQDIEGDFEEWKANVLWPTLQAKYGGGSDKAKNVSVEAAEGVAKTPYSVEFVDSGVPVPDRVHGFAPETVNSSCKHYFTAIDCPVVASRELRSEKDTSGSTLHIDIDISHNATLKYQTADNLAVLPVNDDKIVAKVANKLGLDLDAQFVLNPANGKVDEFKHIFPTPCTVRECLARYCDLTSAPRRSELKVLASYASDSEQKQMILQAASSVDYYQEAVIEKRVGIADMITSVYPSLEITLDHFVHVCPRLKPRYYTISSSSSVNPNIVSATVSILKEDKPDGSVFNGVCSNHLAGITKNNMCRVFIRDSTFRLPQDPSKPIIMVGPGTGIAPMRALLQERSYQKHVEKKNVGKNILYFGCKRRDLDYLYADELEAFQKEGTLTDLQLAFSREREQKVYVQYLLAKNMEETCNLLLNEGAYVYVCGGTRMGSDVMVAILSILAIQGKLGPDGARAYISQMQSDARYIQELWA